MTIRLRPIYIGHCVIHNYQGFFSSFLDRLVHRPSVDDSGHIDQMVISRNSDIVRFPVHTLLEKWTSPPVNTVLP